MLRFGPFALDLDTRRVLRDGAVVGVRERAFDVLLALAEQPGRIVSKRRLCERGWPALADAENNLQVEISALRRHLGAGLIVTVPGRGYQLALPPDVELDAARALLKPGALLTITGEPCSGKSRLAMALASYASTAVMVSITPADDSPDALHRTIARALQVEPAVDPTEALNRRAGLLVLDGCDAAVTAVAELLLRWMPRCPSTCFVVASAELLRLPGERVMRLDPRAGDAPGRHAALAAAVARLPVHERRVFGALGGLPSPCGLDQIQVPDMPPWDVVECLARLIDKSLVQVVGVTPPRYRLTDAARRVALEPA